MTDVTAPLMVGTIAVVGVGSVITDKSVNMKAVAAGGVVALALSAIDNADETVAELLAGLIFLTACYKFLPAVVDKLGFTGGKSGNDVDMAKAKALATPASNTSKATTIPVVQTVPYSVATPQLGGATQLPQTGYQI